MGVPTGYHDYRQAWIKRGKGILKDDIALGAEIFSSLFWLISSYPGLGT